MSGPVCHLPEQQRPERGPCDHTSQPLRRQEQEQSRTASSGPETAQRAAGNRLLASLGFYDAPCVRAVLVHDNRAHPSRPPISRSADGEAQEAGDQTQDRADTEGAQH